MKQFIIGITIFLFPVLLGLCLIEYFLRFIPNDYKYKKEHLLLEADNIQILVLGSSHSVYGIDPEYFSLNGFNFANISQSLDLDYKLLKKYGNKLNKLELIIVPVSYFSMTSRLLDGEEKWRVKNYNIYYNINAGSYLLKNHFEILNGTMLSNVKRIYNYLKNRESSITVSKRGFGLNFSADVKNDLEESGKAAALRHTTNNKDMFLYNEKNIENIIEWCKNHNTKLIFLTFPAYCTYRDNLDKEQLNETINYMKYIDDKYNFVYYYNLLEDENFTEEYFFDADHLNVLGAIKLTKYIDELILDEN
jgi:GTP:adenosylcobinamide-phosphate guanylyltransferase